MLVIMVIQVDFSFFATADSLLHIYGLVWLGDLIFLNFA